MRAFEKLRECLSEARSVQFSKVRDVLRSHRETKPKADALERDPETKFLSHMELGLAVEGTWPRHPVIYEINNWVWLGELSRKYRRVVDLATVPAEEWDQIASGGFDVV